MSSSEHITKAHHIIRCTLTADINRVIYAKISKGLDFCIYLDALSELDY